MRIKHILTMAFLVANIVAIAQVQNKIVVVESTFRPEVEQAEKLGTLPDLFDTSTVRPNIEYSVLPSRLETNYSLKPIKPAKLVGSPLGELYKSQVKIGLGNYTTPLVEFNIHNLRSKEYAVGAYVFHRSSHSNLELENGKKVPAGYGQNRVSLYGKRFYRDVNVEGEVYLNTDKYRFYGYNTELFPDTTLEIDDIKQFYTQVGGRAEVYSTIADSSKMQYRLGIDASYFVDDFDFHESQLYIPAQVTFSVKSFRADLKASYKLFGQQLEGIERNKQVFQFQPQLRKRTNEWEAMVGLNSYIIKNGEADGEFKLFPEARLSFQIVDKVMQAYVGVNGDMAINNFSTVVAENPFVLPGLEVKDTKNNLTGYAGVKGQLASNSGYLFDVSFGSFDNVHFFVNDTNDLQNHFVVRYDDMEQVKFRGELWYSPFTYLDFYLKGQYRSMTLANEAQPWHVPAFAMAFTTRYNFKEKIFASFDVINKGKRYAFDVNNDAEIELDPIWDLNLKVEYKYSEVLSAFVDFHNLLSQRYYLWNQYPSQKINVMIGFSYKF